MILTNDLARIFIPIISYGLTQYGFSNVPIVQAFQPTQQGVNTQPTVFYFKLYDRRYGFLGRNDEYDLVNSRMIHSEKQRYESSFQVNALVINDPLVTNSFVASDLVNAVSQSLQSDYAVQTFESNNVGVLRISEIRNPYFLDDRDQFESSPSFDFTLTYTQVYSSQVPVVDIFDYEIYRI